MCNFCLDLEHVVGCMKRYTFHIELAVGPSFRDFENDGMVESKDCFDVGVVEGSSWGETVVAAEGDDCWEDANDGHVVGNAPGFFGRVFIVKTGKTDPVVVWFWEVGDLVGFVATGPGWDAWVES